MRTLALTISLVACGSANAPPAATRRPALVQSDDRADASTAQSIDASSNPSENVGRDPFERCTAPIQFADTERKPEKLSALEEKQLAFASDFVKRAGTSKDAGTIIPKDVTGGDTEGRMDLPTAKYVQANFSYKSGKYLNAVRAAHELVVEFTDSDPALDTLEIEIVVMFMIGNQAEPRRSDCISAMREDVDRVLAAQCKSPRDDYRKHHCAKLAEIQADLHRAE